MTMLRQIELSCPSCRCQFTSQAVASTDAYGGKRTDFHECAAGMQPLPYQVHLCQHCGYCGSERDFTDQTELSPLVREHVWKELAPHVEDIVAGSDKYSAAAKVAEWQGAESRYVGDLWLRAAWCCVDEGDTEAERYYRRHSAWAFQKTLESYDAVPLDERAVLTYLIGELWRRIGDSEQAKFWFDRVALEVVDSDAQKWVIEAAKRQQSDPQEWFG